MAGQRRSVTCVMSNLTLPSRPSADASVVRGGGVVFVWVGRVDRGSRVSVGCVDMGWVWWVLESGIGRL